MTSTAIAASRSPSILRRELATVEHSRRVLNRGLRVAVLARVATGELTLSEIALRCGRRKQRAGHCPGDTAWLRRRIGDAPEQGPTARRRGSVANCWGASPATGCTSPPVRSSWPDALDPAAPPARQRRAATTAPEPRTRRHRAGLPERRPLSPAGAAHHLHDPQPAPRARGA